MDYRRELNPERQTATQIVLLGTGTPNADPDRSGPAVAIVVHDTPYLIDCGPGVVRRAAAAFRNGIAGLEVTKLKRLFLTHLHSDHTVGYPDLIFTPWVLERNEPLEVCGPPGTRRMTEFILAAYADDIDVRCHGPEQANDRGYRVNAREIAAGIGYQDENVVVTTFAVNHGRCPALGYKFTTPDKIIVISGDTRPVDSIIEQGQGCDVLIHEVYAAERLQSRPEKWRQYHAITHTSTYELADIAAQTEPGLLILYHQLFWGASEEELLDEIRPGYAGGVVCGNDLDVY